MTRSVAVSRLGSEFDDFLFAPIGDDGNGMLLSVLSALARLNIDPWLEAATLARLPTAIATEQLGLLIARLPGGLSAYPDPGTIAARLITRLPSQINSKIPAPTMPRETGVANSARAVIRVVLINVFLVAFMLASQWMVVGHHVPAQAETHPAPPSTASAQMSPPSYRQ